MHSNAPFVEVGVEDGPRYTGVAVDAAD